VISCVRGCHWLRAIDFAPDAMLREVRGFQGCGITCITIPSHVEIVTETAFADCLALEIVRFTRDSRLRLIDGFRQCPVRELQIPSGVMTIGRSGFRDCRYLQRVRFTPPSELRIIEGFCGISAHATVKVPPQAVVQSEAFGRGARLFVLYAESALARFRRVDRNRPVARHPCVAPSQCPVPEIVPEVDTADETMRRIVASYAHLPQILDAGRYNRSLAFRLRLRKKPLQCANPVGHTRYFLCLRNPGENEGTIPLESLIAMLAFSQDFACQVLRREQAFHFTIT
jgi:hypothetical protein